MALRNIIKVSLHPPAKKVIEQTAERNGMREIVVVSRVLTWFAEQDDVLRKGILGILPEGYEADVAKLALERIASGKGKAK